eukprot:2658210-Rhodomonas_salina.3
MPSATDQEADDVSLLEAAGRQGECEEEKVGPSVVVDSDQSQADALGPDPEQSRSERQTMAPLREEQATTSEPFELKPWHIVYCVGMLFGIAWLMYLVFTLLWITVGRHEVQRTWNAATCTVLRQVCRQRSRSETCHPMPTSAYCLNLRLKPRAQIERYGNPERQGHPTLN